VDKEEEIHRGINKGDEFTTTVTGGQNELSAFFREHGHTLSLGQEEPWRGFETKVLGAVAKTGLIDMDALRACTFGTRKTPGIRRTELALHNVLIDRGRVWYNCQANKVDSKTGKVSVTPDEPDPHEISPKLKLCVFEENNIEDKGRYLGQFTVVDVDEAEKLVGLEPTMKLSPAELDRLVRAKARGPWTMYEVMPADTHAIFAELTEDQKRALLPPQSVQAYVSHGEPAEGEELPGCVIEDGKHVRRLRDYGVLFGEYHRQRSAMADQMQAGQRDLRYSKAALADANKQVLFRQNEIDDLKTEFAKVEDERKAVTTHFQALKDKVTAFQKDVEQTIVANREMAARIAKIQLEATRRIDERVDAMADASK
jgi:hypothetical protein